MKTIFVWLILFSPVVFAQQELLTDIKGEVVMKSTYTEVSGSPYLFGENWLKGEVVDIKDKKLENLELRFDAYKNQLQYNSPQGAMVAKANTFKAFTIQNQEGSHHFAEFLIDNKKLLCEVLYKGKYTFIVHHKLILNEQKAFNSAVVEKSFERQKNYYIFDQQALRLKLNQKSILEVLPQEKAAVEQFVKNTKSKLKDEQAVIDLLMFLEK